MTKASPLRTAMKRAQAQHRLAIKGLPHSSKAVSSISTRRRRPKKLRIRA